MPDDGLREWLTTPDGLSTRLRTLRIQAGLNGQAMAQHLGCHSAKVSRIEHGHQLASAADIRAWATACGATSNEIDELLGLLQDATSIHLNWARRMRDGQAPVQRSYTQLLQAASLYQSMQHLLLPGLLQTPDYARVVLADSRAEVPALLTNDGFASSAIGFAVFVATHEPDAETGCEGRRHPDPAVSPLRGPTASTVMVGIAQTRVSAVGLRSRTRLA